MLNLKYIGDPKSYPVTFNTINENVVEVIGDIPKKETGFMLTRIGDPFAFTGDYSDFKTVYREVEGGFQYSNDESTYDNPIPIVNFNTSGSGVLNGETQQKAKNYEDLIIPTPEANKNHEFTEWIPEIPESGVIEGNQTFTAIFTSVISIDERVTALENDVQSINEALGG